jgi:hypothetical protein
MPAAPTPAQPWQMTAAATNRVFRSLGREHSPRIGPPTGENRTSTLLWTGTYPAPNHRGTSPGPGTRERAARHFPCTGGCSADEDLAAIFTYLQSIPVVKNRVPDYIVGATPPAAFVIK